MHREAYWLAGLNPNLSRGFRNTTAQGLCAFLHRVGRHDELRELIEKELADPSRTQFVDIDQLIARKIDSYFETGDFEEAIASLSSAPKKNPYLKNSQSKLCRALFELGRYEEANAILPIASQLSSDDYLPRQSLDLEELLRRTGRGDSRTPDEIEAEIPTEETERRLAGTVNLLMQLARRQMVLGRIEAADASLAEAASIAAERCPSIDRVYIDLIVEQALLRLAAEDAAGAIVELERALEAVNARYPKESLVVSEFLHQAGLIALAAGDSERAQQYLDDAITIRRRRWSEVNERVWRPVLDRVEATLDPNERRAFLRAEIRLMAQRGVSTWRIAVLTRELGAAERLLGEFSSAERALIDAWSVFQPMLGEAHELSRATAMELFMLYDAQGQWSEAEKWRDRAEGGINAVRGG